MIYFDIIDVCYMNNELAKTSEYSFISGHVPTSIFKRYFGVAMYFQREVQIAVNLKSVSYPFHKAECSV